MHAMQDSTSRHSEVNGVQTDKVSLIPSLSSLKRFPGLSSQKLQTEIGRIEKPRADEEKEKPVKLSEVKKGKKPLKTHDSNDSSTSSSDEEDDQENEHAQRMRKKFKLI